MTGATQPAWSVRLTQEASDVLTDIRKFDGDKLHDETVRFLRTFALEVGAARAKGKKPSGTPLSDGRYTVDVYHEDILIYYLVDDVARQILVTELVWL